MRGTVNPDLEATLPVQVSRPGGPSMQVVAVIDTGYSGNLSLSSAVIGALALPPLAPRVVRLADRSTRVVNSYEAEVLWAGQSRTVRVLALEGASLIGTALLKGHDLKVEFVDGGEVVVEARP